MKVFQIEHGLCYWDATYKFPSVEATVGFFPPDLLFVEAPDHVFEGWGFDPEKEGDERFVQPEPPEGWLYDAATGTFYPEEEPNVGSEPTQLDRIEAQVTYTAMMTDTLLEV